MTRIAVTGGRNFNNPSLVAEVFSEYSLKEIDLVMHGGANGLDSQARDWAMKNGIQTASFPANWNYYGKSAGRIRNFCMLSAGQPDFLLAFPGGRGTENCIKTAKNLKIPVTIISDE